jgi:hypothetical protein
VAEDSEIRSELAMNIGGFPNRHTRASLLAVLVASLLIGLLGVVLTGRPDPVLMRQPLVMEALRPLGVAEPTWQTLVIYASRDIELPRDTVFEAWSKLDAWPSWARPLILQARWLDLPGWRAGARFEQTLDLGFPLSRLHTVETVTAANSGHFVSWSKEESGVRSNHVWSFEELPDGGTRIVDFEIFQGALAGFARPLVERGWQARFEDAVTGLVAYARKGR